MYENSLKSMFDHVLNVIFKRFASEKTFVVLDKAKVLEGETYLQLNK